MECPVCGKEWNTEKYNSCKCGAFICRTYPLENKSNDAHSLLGEVTKCPHCDFLLKTFCNSSESTDREYFLMTEVFVYLHGKDFCDFA